MTDALTFEEVAERLKIAGRNPVRTVRGLFERHGVPYLRLGKGVYRATEGQMATLMEAITCCTSDAAEADISTVEAQSASGVRRGTSKSTLRGAVQERLQKPTKRSSRRKSKPRSFTVLEGGRNR